MGKKFVLNRQGVAELMKSAKMQDILNAKAKEVASRCGDGYEVSAYVGKSRANASVKAETKQAKLDNSKNNILLKALK